MTENRQELRRSDARNDLDQLFNNTFHRYSLPMSHEGMITWLIELVCYQRSPTIEQMNDLDMLTREFVNSLNECEFIQIVNVYNKYINTLQNQNFHEFELNLDGFNVWEEWNELQQHN